MHTFEFDLCFYPTKFLSGVARGGVGADAPGRTPKGRTTMLFFTLWFYKKCRTFCVAPHIDHARRKCTPWLYAFPKQKLRPPSSVSFQHWMQKIFCQTFLRCNPFREMEEAALPVDTNFYKTKTAPHFCDSL